ncbi:MAG: hypothetical protein ACR2KQ_09665 [Actinomycetota bacterium]
MIVKGALLVVAGAVGALELDKRLGKMAARMRPGALTGSLLDQVNERLEKKQPSR